MKHTKRLTSIILSIVMLLSITAGLDFSTYADNESVLISGDYEYRVIDDSTAEITGYYGTEKNIIIPSKIDKYTVTQIYSYCFENNETIESLSIPDSVNVIWQYAFYNCINLSEIHLPDSIELISERAFENTAYYNSNDNWKDNVLYIDNMLIKADNNITGKCTIKDETKTIAYHAFSDCIYLDDVIMPDSVINTVYATFSGCSSLESITLSKSLKSIANREFSNCVNLKNIKIPKSVNLIEAFAFQNCSSLESIFIPNNVETIMNGAFYWCNSLQKIVIENPNCVLEEIGSGCIIPDSATIYGYKNSTAQAYAQKWGRKFVALDNEHTHTYKTTVTKATTKKNGSIVTKCSVCGISKKATIYYPKTISLSATSYTYNGKVKTPSVTVKDAKGKKISSKYYTVSYSKGRKNVGQYTVTIKFKGNYSGTVKKTFTIKPKATTLSKVTAGKKAFTVKWKKQATQTTGYQIQYSTSSKFKGAKTVTVSKNKTTSKKISKLKAKKKYYVRVRTYKTVKVNGKNTKIYSSWSKAKTVKTK